MQDPSSDADSWPSSKLISWFELYTHEPWLPGDSHARLYGASGLHIILYESMVCAFKHGDLGNKDIPQA
jgi:hypothetical protein